MSVNVLNQALRLIGGHTVDYQAFLANQRMADGSLCPQYAASIKLIGYFEPIASTQKLALGLDLKTNYARFFVSHQVLPTSADRSNDRLCFGGYLYNVSGETNWLKQNGWKELFLTEIGKA